MCSIFDRYRMRIEQIALRKLGQESAEHDTLTITPSDLIESDWVH